MASSIVETQNLIDRLLVNPDPVDPYRFDGVSYAPRFMDRIMRTPADVIHVIRQAKAVRSMETEDIVTRSGVSPEEVLRFEQEGTGTTQSLFSVLGALGVRPVTMPDFGA